MARVTSWRSSLLARWLGWTVMYGLVVVGGAWLLPRLPPPAGGMVFLGLPVIAAFLIGVRFRSEWWAAGPPVVLVTLVTAEILWELMDKLGPQVPAQPPTPQASVPPVITMLVLGSGLVMVSAVLAVAAYKGVTWGQRRENEAAVRDAARSEGESRSG